MSSTPVTVTIYSRTGCVQCNATYRDMRKLGIAYDVQDAVEEANNALIHSLGIMQAPAVVIRENSVIVESWGGFRPDKIAELVLVPA